MSKRELKALQEKGIRVGDTVRTAYRGGVRQGKVTKITEESRVVFTRKRQGQPDKEVKHNPTALEKMTEENEEESGELSKARSTKARSGGRWATGAAASRAAAAGGKKQAAAAKEPAAPKTPTKAKGWGGKTAGNGGTGKRRASGRLAAKRKAAEQEELTGGNGGRKRKATASKRGRAKRGRA